MKGAWIVVKICLFVMTTAEERSTTGLPKFQMFQISLGSPEYLQYKGENGLFSVINVLGSIGNKLFEKAVDRFNTWMMDSPSKSYVVPRKKHGGFNDLLFASSNSQFDSFPDLPHLSSDPIIKYSQPTFQKPNYVEYAEAWWNPKCKYCYDDPKLINFLPTKFSPDVPVVKHVYEDDFYATSSSKPQTEYSEVRYQKLPYHPLRRPHYHQHKKPHVKIPKWTKASETLWHPIPPPGFSHSYQQTHKLKSSPTTLHPLFYGKAMPMLPPPKTKKRVVHQKTFMMPIRPAALKQNIWREILRINTTTASTTTTIMTTETPPTMGTSTEISYSIKQ